MIRIGLAAGLFFTLSLVSEAMPPRLSSAAQAPATRASLPTADKVLDNYIQVLGGKATIEKLTSRVVKGTTEWGEGYGAGTTEYYFKAPGKYMSVDSLPGMGTTREGFNGETGWGMNTAGKTRDWAAHEVAAAKRYRDYYRNIRLQTLYPKINVTGQERLGRKQVYVVELTPASGRPEKMYFDVDTHLLLMHEYEVEGPQGVRAFAYYYEDYRDVDGIKVAFTIKRLSPMPTYAFKASEVKHNTDIEDEKFNKPPTQ